MKAAIYLRVSTEEQREKQSIEVQRDYAKRYCEQHEITVADWYADDGVTGTLPLSERPVGKRLLRDASAKQFDTVLVYKMDRFGRDPRLVLNAINELEKLNVELQSMSESFDGSSPSGRLMRSMLSSFAGFERETFIQRSVEGRNRLLRLGAWISGITPYGYRVEGRRREARLVISEEPVPGTTMSEADVVRLIYRLAGDEGKSCIVIASHLNSLGVPPAYVRDALQNAGGKRRKATSGIWRSGRIRNMLVNTTYRGLHEYGKRTTKRQELISRPMPAIVDEALWHRAQATMKRNFKFGQRNAKRKYLLRGLAKCAHCGLTYIGTAWTTRGGIPRIRYICNGKHQGRAIFGDKVGKCSSMTINGDLEDRIWKDIERFLRSPGEVLRELKAQSRGHELELRRSVGEVQGLRQALEAKGGEHDRILGLYRRGRIDDTALDGQLDQIEQEKAQLRGRIRELEAGANGAQTAQRRLESTETLLQELAGRLDQPMTWELKRQLVELMVAGIRVETKTFDGVPEAEATVSYCFGLPGIAIDNRNRVAVAGSGTRGAAASAPRPRSRSTTRG